MPQKKEVWVCSLCGYESTDIDSVTNCEKTHTTDVFLSHVVYGKQKTMPEKVVIAHTQCGGYVFNVYQMVGDSILYESYLPFLRVNVSSLSPGDK